MDPTLPDPFDPSLLRLPAGMIGTIDTTKRPPRHRRGERFLKGPIPWEWWSTACRLPGQALQVASALRYRAGWGGTEGIRLGLADLEPTLGVSRSSARRGLRALEGAGLVSVSRRSGSKPVVSPLDRPPSGKKRGPLYGPIPWDWWVLACRLPGRSLQVASALWFMVGWSRNREARFEFGLAEWAELGLSRFSAGRGIECLHRAGLVSVVLRPGCRAFVTIAAVPDSSGADGRA
jgi:DNA-binding transcriptional ArsR family regulator